MTDTQGAVRRLCAYIDALPDSANLGAQVMYGPKYDAAGSRPAGCYALDRADLSAVLDELARIDKLAAARQRVIERMARESLAVEAAVQRVRDKATEWTTLAPADDWGMTPTDTVLADAGRYLLALIDQPGRTATSSPQEQEQP